MGLSNIVSISNRAYVKKTDDINRLNSARSNTDGDNEEAKLRYSLNFALLAKFPSIQARKDFSDKRNDIT